MAWDVRGRTAIVTGGNTGIGRATAAGLAERGAQVILTARDPGKGEEAATAIAADTGGDVTWMLLDLASFASIRAFAAEVLDRCDAVHVLVNNAGLILADRRETDDGFEATFGVNHLGHFLLTQLLLDRIVASAPGRILNVSSDAHRSVGGLDFDDLQLERGYRSMTAYGRSKLANILFTRELARRLDGTGVTVNAVHPGVVNTDFGQGGDTRLWSVVYKLFGWAFRTPERGARTTLHVACDPALDGVTGRYFANSRATRPSRAARDDDAARRLWDESERLVQAASGTG